MVDIGQKVCFIPHWNINEHDVEETKREKTVTGKVIYVDRDHRKFTVKYSIRGGAEMKETFKLSQIGEDVHVLRGGKHGS